MFAGQTGFAQLEHVAQPRLELAPVDRFGEKVACAAVERVVAHVALVAGGDHQDGQIVAVAVRADAADELQAVHLGHHVIDDDEVGLIGQAPLERRGGALEGVGPGIGSAVDELADQGQVEQRVIDDRDLHRTVEWEIHPLSIGIPVMSAEELLRGRSHVRARCLIRAGRSALRC